MVRESRQEASEQHRQERARDRAADPDDNPELKVVTAGKGFRVTGGPAGVFWNPANTATGNYTVKATFTLLQPSNHTNYYGIVFGGSDLDNAKQELPGGIRCKLRIPAINNAGG